MKLDVKFVETDQSFNLQFDEYQTASSGGYDKGYAVGYKVGNADGYTKGHMEGVEEGYAAGYEKAVQDFTIENKLVQLVENTITEVSALNLAGATKIASYGFYVKNKLTRVALPATVKQIDAGAFAYSGVLRTVIVPSDTVVNLTGKDAFSGTPINNQKDGYIYVPDNLVEQYKTATNWSTYASQIKPLSELNE